ncbi:hypothetical protein M0805_004022 [Coniferiporia weirii]|nr:hypothetical protein M0805_004022 [Coniferiporia weirii]
MSASGFVNLIPAVGAATSNDNVRVTLAPKAGFCIKSITTDTGFYIYASTASVPSSNSKQPNLLEPPSAPRTLQIAKGVKVFLNIAWDARVPSPPPVDEAVISRAMSGDDLDDPGENNNPYYVPVVVSEPREETDKSGKPSLVFDCVFSAALKARCTKDQEFKMYLIELSLEHVEEKVHVILSRQIGTPNIASKGKLETRTVMMSKALLSPGGAEQPPTTPLVQELSAPTSTADSSGSSGSGKTPANTDNKKTQSTPALKKSILKNGTSSSSGKPQSLIEDITDATSPVISTSVSENSVSNKPGSSHLDPFMDLDALSVLPPPRWTWTTEGVRLGIEIQLPNFTHDLHADSKLDIEPRRILLSVPRTYFLDINLNLPDAQIGRIGASRVDDAVDTEEAEGLDVDTLRVKGYNVGQALRLKRQRDFDVDGARAEWRVQEGKLVLFA